MTKRGAVKLTDFGIARVLNENSRARTRRGTPYYISPELLNGNPHNTKTDVWSLGVLLFELVALQVPFHAAVDVQVMLKIISKDARPLPDHAS